jgi:hypothetical protein
VACLVNEGNSAWHAGNRWYNTHSIGIECRPECTSGDVDTVAELVATIYKHVGKVLPLIGHKDIVATACPGRYYSKIADIQRRATALYQTGKMPAASSGSGSSASSGGMTASQAVASGQAWSEQITGHAIAHDGIYGPDTKANGVRVLQWALNKDYGAGLTIDGQAGPLTYAALGNHYVRSGETQYMVTACEVLLMINGYNPHGVEIPGTFGSGCSNAVGAYQRDAGLTVDHSCGRNTFSALIK